MSRTFKCSIQAPPERVFHLIEDPERRNRWQRGLEETIYTYRPEGDDPVGTRFIARVREGLKVTEYEGELTAYSKPALLEVRVGNRSITITTRYALTPEGEGTRLALTTEVKPHGLLAWLAVFMGRRFLEGIVTGQLQALQRLAEEEEA